MARLLPMLHWIGFTWAYGPPSFLCRAVRASSLWHWMLASPLHALCSLYVFACYRPVMLVATEQEDPGVGGSKCLQDTGPLSLQPAEMAWFSRWWIGVKIPAWEKYDLPFRKHPQKSQCHVLLRLSVCIRRGAGAKNNIPQISFSANDYWAQRRETGVNVECSFKVPLIILRRSGLHMAVYLGCNPVQSESGKWFWPFVCCFTKPHEISLWVGSCHW